jgi:hypothetical protein
MIMLNNPALDWPTTIDETVERVLATLTDAERDVVRKTPESDLDLLHFGLGLRVRNEFGLASGESRDLLTACGSAVIHPDDVSDVIVRAIWAKLQAGS